MRAPLKATNVEDRDTAGSRRRGDAQHCAHHRRLYAVRTFGQDSTLTTTTGWDDVTGIGVPTPRYFKTAG